MTKPVIAVGNCFAKTPKNSKLHKLFSQPLYSVFMSLFTVH